MTGKCCDTLGVISLAISPLVTLVSEC